MVERPVASDIDLKCVKTNIQRVIIECSRRGLNSTSLWLSQLNNSLKNIQTESTFEMFIDPEVYDPDYDIYVLAKSYLDLKEYERCTYYTSRSTNQICRFLYLHSKFLAVERDIMYDLTDDWPDSRQKIKLQRFIEYLSMDYLNHKLDSYVLYLYGMVLKYQQLRDEAIRVFVEAVHKEPLHWKAWNELGTLITDRSQLGSLVLPDHWMKKFFIGQFYLDQQLCEEALDVYAQLQVLGFGESDYLLAKIATAYVQNRDVIKSTSILDNLRTSDPGRLNDMDIYSNLLYVTEMNVELAILAHQSSEISLFRPETCCIIGNYYSLCSDHEKAVLYFERALRIDPYYSSAWTLMGHEFVELKNTNLAILSYRKAIEANHSDYRAWYGLGQTYEILKMTRSCLYYYTQAQFLQPNDSRVLVALGETYEALDKDQEALKCFYKARCVGDIEGLAALRLAKLYEKLNMMDQAMSTYSEYVTDSRDVITEDNKSDLAHAYTFLANHLFNTNSLEMAHEFAQKCLTFEEAKEAGKALLKCIAIKRNNAHDSKFMSCDKGKALIDLSTSRQQLFCPDKEDLIKPCTSEQLQVQRFYLSEIVEEESDEDTSPESITGVCFPINENPQESSGGASTSKEDC